MTCVHVKFPHENINMKRILITGFLVLLYMKNANACDVCGCSIGNGFSSVLPQFHTNFIGIRQGFTSFETTHPDENTVHKESAYTAELWARYYVHRRIQVLASLPYNVKTSHEGITGTRTRGVGDLQLSMNYTLINRNKDTQRFKHLWLVGAGVKLPTGAWRQSAGDDLLPEAMQPGSGSLDYIYTTMYTIRYRKIGWSSDLQYKINYENGRSYAFGNKLSAGSRVFYWKNIRKNCNVIPSTGVLMEKIGYDYQYGQAQQGTGGQVVSASLGCELYYRRIAISCLGSYPLQQQLGYIKAMPRLQLTTSLIF